ncbi:thrombomodulin [Thomomys bottae]
MFGVLLLGVLARAGLGSSGPVQQQPTGSQCVEHDCYALFRGPVNFLAASQACERLQGHLMTVRSTVAADVISLLLSGDSSVGPEVWIGLHLPQGCSSPGKLGPLRGFQWVTGDNHTSYSRWARPDDHTDDDGAPVCGPRCVTVSAAAASLPSEPTWEARQCDAKAGGFLCEFHFPAYCRPLEANPRNRVAAPLSSTYITPFGARSADFQTLPVGSSVVVEPLGLTLLCSLPPDSAAGRWSREAPGAWDCGVENGGCEYACNSTAGTPSCSCPGNLGLQADGRFCAAPLVQKCTDFCEHFCYNNPVIPGAYTCMCETGYRLAADLHHCEDVDDCMLTPNLCPQRCVNTKGGFDCLCYDGYDLVDGECVEPLDPCLGSNCEYQCQPVSPTEYRCICAEGFRPIPHSPHLCQMFCNQTACKADCDPYNPDYCQCPEGFILDEGFMCADIDECSQGECRQGECRNFPGSFECLCGPDSPFAGQITTNCDPDPPIIVSNKGNEEGSGEPPFSTRTPGSTLRPPTAGPVHSGVVIGISVASLSLVVALLALLCHLRKKQSSTRAELEYKCGTPVKEVVLQNVRTEGTPQKL